MAVVERFRDGSYSWRCDDCGQTGRCAPHRGPRKSVCKRCQNIRYRGGESGPPERGAGDR